MKERLLRLPAFSTWFSAIALLGALSLANDTKAQEHSLPPECYRDDGYVDLATCTSIHHEYIPLEELEGGYWGVYGYFMPDVPNQEMEYYLPDFYFETNATYVSEARMQSFFNEDTFNMGMDEATKAKYLGGIIVDSPAAIGMTAWVRKAGGEWIGPFLVVDAAGLVHMYDRACNLPAGIELSRDIHSLLDDDDKGLAYSVIVMLYPPGDLTSVPGQDWADPTTIYHEAWLKQAGLPCAA